MNNYDYLRFIWSGLAADVYAAVAAISKDTISFPLRYVNLVAETSEPVAVVLTERNIPFAFAIGYGDAMSLPKHFPSAPVIQKLYGIASIQNVLAILEK